MPYVAAMQRKSAADHANQSSKRALYVALAIVAAAAILAVAIWQVAI